MIKLMDLLLLEKIKGIDGKACWKGYKYAGTKDDFGHGGTSAKRKTMSIRKSNPKRRKAFRARFNCDKPGPKTMARYWSCKKW